MEKAYLLAVRSVNADLIKATRRFVASALSVSNGRALRADADDLSAFAELDFGVLRVRLGRLAGAGARRIVDQFGTRIGRFNRADLERILKIDLAEEPPGVRRVLEAWRRENVSLISSIASRLHEDVHDVVRDATRRGTRVETLSRQLEERYDVSRSRANLIARDQVMKANADLTRARHEAAGIERYVWSTSKDERVRGTPGGKWPDGLHYGLEGTIQRWDDPPVTNERGDRNHPGQDFQCRCVAIPVLDAPPEGDDQGSQPSA